MMNHEEQQKTKNEYEDEDEAIGRDLAFALRRRYVLIPYADTNSKVSRTSFYFRNSLI